MTTGFLHGVETIEVLDGVRPVRINATGIIAIVGTAPLADPVLWPLDEPILLLNKPLYAATLGTSGTLYAAIKQAMAEGAGTFVIVRVAYDADPNVQMSKIIGDQVQRTGVWALLNARSKLGVQPKTLTAPGFTSVRPTTGIASVTVQNGGTGYVVGQTQVTASGGGTGFAATPVIDANGTITSIVVTNPGVGYSNPTISVVGAGQNFQGTAIVAAARNPVTAALLSIAPRLRAIVYADVPSTTPADAFAWRQNWGDMRLVPFFSDALIWSNDDNAYVDQSQAASQAGLTARVHRDNGFWYSPSNFELLGVGGTAVPVDVGPNDDNSTANYLNENAINTIVNFGGNYAGYRRWGNRTTSADSEWVFESVRRTADVIYDALEEAYLWMVDKPFSIQLLLDASAMGNRFIRYLVSTGALVGGSVWLNPERNAASQLQQGILAWDIDLEPPAPMERIQIYAHRNADYYTEALTQFSSQVTA